MLIFDQLKKNDATLRNLALAVFAGMCILLAGLWYIQVMSSRRYVESEKDQSFRTVRIPAVRGKILDRSGISLAENRASYNVSLYLGEMRKPFQQEYKRATSGAKGKFSKKQREELELQSRLRVASGVVQYLSTVMHEPIELDGPSFHRHYEKRRVLPLPVLQNLTAPQIARFQEQPAYPAGVDLEVQPTRVYPYGTAAAHLIGHLKHDDSSVANEVAFFNYRLQDFRGVLGLEAAFDQELRGQAGIKSVQVNRLGYRQAENIWAAAEPGKNVVLTIDLPVQLAAENALRSHPAMGTNARGAVVVMNVKNGDILAMASNPAFDPNQFVRGLSSTEAQWLLEPKLTPQVNRATQGIYLPGSIFKIITGLAALEAGVLNPAEIYHSPGVYPIGRGIKDTAEAGDYDFRRAFIKSSNCYFIEYGLRAHLDRILDMGHRFFLGERSGLPVYGQDKGGIFPTMEWVREARRRGQIWTDGDTANLCFGQGMVAVTPMQMAVMTSAVANGGKIFWPRLVQRLEVQEPVPNENPSTMLPVRFRGDLGVQVRNLEIIREAMMADVEDREGTAHTAFFENDKLTPVLKGMRVGGKTGTAQIMQGGKVVDHVTWFVSFTSPENPRYAVVVMVESGSSGGGTCAPIALKVYKELLRHEAPGKPASQTVAQLP